MDCFLGVDVGTGSARAALFDEKGVLVGKHGVVGFPTRNSATNYYEQSSDDIWEAVTGAVKSALASVPHSQKINVAGIGFDATCSLVVMDSTFAPLSVSKSPDHVAGDQDTVWNIIVWMDHRASEETAHINFAGADSPVLSRYGGAIFVENELPKLLWLKRHTSKDGRWAKAAHFMDLADFLTWRATGSLTRGECALACKWGRSETGWDLNFMKMIGLEDLIEPSAERIGLGDVLAPGKPVPGGLSSKVAREWGLAGGVPVAAGMVDAHAGGVGMVGAEVPDESTQLGNRLAIIAGSSTCHLIASAEPVYVPGVWGPFYNAMVPGTFLAEGGQSATGVLLDHILQSSSCGAALPASERHTIVGDRYVEMVREAVASGNKRPTNDLHVLPYFHGDRSPRADASLQGVISGVQLSDTLDDLARLYGATMEALVYGARHIISSLEAAGHGPISHIYACGGLAKSRSLFVQALADGCQRPVILLEEEESVLLGSAICAAACAGKHGSSVSSAMSKMSRCKEIILPGKDQDFHNRKYAVFLRMYDQFMELRDMMN